MITIERMSDKRLLQGTNAVGIPISFTFQQYVPYIYRSLVSIAIF